MIEEEGARSPLDPCRVILLVVLMILLLSPDQNSGKSSNLRDEDTIQKQRKERKALESQLEMDIRAMQNSSEHFPYNISGIYLGKWNRRKNENPWKPKKMLLGLIEQQTRDPNNSTLQGEEGSLSIQLYDRGYLQYGIHQISGVMTMIEGDQDSKDDALSLSLLGVYFIYTGQLSLYANSRGGRFALIWETTDTQNMFNITNHFPEKIGYTSNGLSCYYLTPPSLLPEKSNRCLYRMDMNLLHLENGLDPEISHNKHNRMLLNATGVLESTNCNIDVSLSFSGFNMDTNHITKKSRIYTSILILVTLGESFLYVQQMRHLLIASASAASLILFIFISAIDLLVAMLHSMASVFFLGLFSEFYLISFNKLFVFSMIEMRLIFVIWRSRYPDINADNYMLYQRKLSAVFFGLYLLIIVTLVSVYTRTILGYILILVLYSFWVPQVSLFFNSLFRSFDLFN